MKNVISIVANQAQNDDSQIRASKLEAMEMQNIYIGNNTAAGVTWALFR